MEDITAMRKTATTTVPVQPLLAERWSPRGFDQAHELADDRLAALPEAARWAPSAANSQPWRFGVARRGEEAHTRLFAALARGNQAWAGAASALVFAVGCQAGPAGLPGPPRFPRNRPARKAPARRPAPPCPRRAPGTASGLATLTIDSR
jgi:nitroreductase